MSFEHTYDDGDIYRGEPAAVDIRSPSPRPSLHSNAPSGTSSSSSSSSSSDSSFPGGKLGVLAAKVEHAISKWARNVRGNASDTSSGSSSSSSSSSSQLSNVTLTKSQMARRKRRRASVSSLRTLQSERDIAARITRLKAIEESRFVPRLFTLYLPKALTAGRSDSVDAKSRFSYSPNCADGRITFSSSLPSVLSKLEAATQKHAKVRRVRNKHRLVHVTDSSPSPPTPPFASISNLQIPRKANKGKNRVVPATIPEEPSLKPQAWFLDVANPTWADLRAIGKLLHIHPLTLEDILQRDPREKLEIFSKLGYYFISFRAIENEATREKIRREASITGNNPFDDISVGEANVYLTVFKDGICCFHYTDVSEHTNRVRNRMVLLEDVVHVTSDWIAYDILDSVVDSFFPLLERIEREVMAIETLVFSSLMDTPIPADLSTSAFIPSSPAASTGSEEPASSQATKLGVEFSEKKGLTEAEKIRDDFRPRFASPKPTVAILLRRCRRYIWRNFRFAFRKKGDRGESPLSATQMTLRRMAMARKLVTSLGRLLATKSDVVTQVRKRLIRTADQNAKTGQVSQESDLAMYMGDLQDHILTLQHSLAHYERMLSQSHPTYLAQLRSNFETTKSGTDKNLLYLTVVSISVLCMQTITGAFSMNIQVPHSDNGHAVFGIVLCLVSVVLCTYLCVVRYWLRQAKRLRNTQKHVS